MKRFITIQQMITRYSFYLLAWCTFAVAPTFAQSITHVPLFTFDGDSPGDFFGISVSGAGDVNGDGVADVIVGAPGRGGGGGSARVLSGTDGSVLYNFNGDSIGENFGESVSGAGDVNGDGVDDLIVGNSFDSNEGFFSGSARVFSGADGSVLYNFEGDSDFESLGQSVSGAGDVNGDGFADMIAGAPGDNLVGSARVFSGADGSVLYNFEGDSMNGNFGYSVSGAGDVNGDGFADVIVGARADGNNGPDTGSAWVFSGSDGSVLYNFDGDSAGDRFGQSVSGAGDVNGDGFADVIVGANTEDTSNGSDSGSARVFSGADGSVLYNFDGDSASDNFGESVSGAGDVNGDGFADVIVGAHGDDNNGIRSGSARVFSGSDGRVLYNFDGDSPDDRFGWSVSGVGDVNGDGVADFIVGSAVGDGTTGDGYARLFVSQISPFVLGDANRDGVVDLLDIPPFIELLTSGTFLEQADCNQDGVVSLSDIPQFIVILLAARP